MKRDELERIASDPIDWLSAYARRHPTAWRDFDTMRKHHATTWPAWCFIPIAGAQAQVAAYLERDWTDLTWQERGKAATEAAILAALAAWRMTKGVYIFDRTLADALWRTPVTGRIPTSVLHNLPEWCVYLRLDRRVAMGHLFGAWAHLDHDRDTNVSSLRVIFNVAGEALVPTVITLGGSIDDGIRETTGSQMVEEAVTAMGRAVAELHAANALINQLIEPIVSTLLYLCSAEPEVAGAHGHPRNPQPRKVKGGMKLIAAQQVREWNVGVMLGRALRAAAEHADREDASGSGRTVRPHVRRAHWHTFLTGPRDSERTPVLKWLHPMLVGGGAPEDLPVVVHPVKGPR